MAIKTTCGCGAQFMAKAELAGKRLTCPSCGQPLLVPNPQGPTSKIRVACQCGQAFQAKAELAGKRVKCPSCGQPLAIPAAPSVASPGSDPLGLEVTTADPLASGPDPFVGGATPHDPLALGHPEGDLFGDGPAAPVGQFNAATGSPTTVPRPANRGKRRRAESQPYGKENILEVATGVLAIYHGGSAIYRAIVAIVMMVKASTVIGPRAFVSLSTLLFLLGIAVSAGILAGGIGVLMRRQWGLQVGVPASCAYFALLAIGLLMGLVGMARLLTSDAGGAGMWWMLVWIVPRTIIDSLGPGMMIFLHQRRAS